MAACRQRRTEARVVWRRLKPAACSLQPAASAALFLCSMFNLAGVMQQLCVCGCVCVRWGFRARDSLIGLIRRSLCTAPERIVLFLPSFFFAPPVFCFDVPQTDVIALAAALAAAVTSSPCRLKCEPPALLLSYPSPPSLLLLFPLGDECVSADLPPPSLRCPPPGLPPALPLPRSDPRRLHCVRV